MRPLARLASLALLLLAPGLRAEPLPAGWIAGGTAQQMTEATPPGPRSLETLQLRQRRPRTAVTPVPLSLGDFETVTLEPAPTEAQMTATNLDMPGEPATDLIVVDKCKRASVSGHAFGYLQVGWEKEPIGPQSSRGPSLTGVRGWSGLGDGQHLYVRAEWETVDHLADGTVRFNQTVARFHVPSCKAKVARRFSAVARPILGGLAYAFRERCPRCAPGARDRLHLIMPGGESFSHRTLKLEAGSGDFETTHASDFALQQFGRVVGRAFPHVPGDRFTLIAVESTQGLGEAAPSVIAYAAEVIPSRLF